MIRREFLRLALMVSAGMGTRAGTLGLRGQQPPRLRVLTYNIHHGEGTDGKFDYERLARVINGLKPDVAALQEVDRNTRRANGVDQAALLAKLTGMRSAFANALTYQGGEYGEAILSRFPMDQVRAHHLPFRLGQEPRTALEARITQDNGVPEFILVGTHLCHQSNETRVEQVSRINRIFSAAEGPPVIFAGDLNARPGSEPMKILLQERWLVTIAPRSRIDYVLVRPADPWRVVEVTIVDDRVTSDHRPVLAVLEWRGEVSK